MASIMSLEVHKLVQTTNLDTLSQDIVDLGPLVLDTLGILEWLNIFQIAEKGRSLKALSCLQ